LPDKDADVSQNERTTTAPESGSYVLVEPESGDGWKTPPPADAVRTWMRRPGAAGDDDHNWTTWLHKATPSEWISAYAIDEWLPPGVEPDWA